ncbi:tryptophan--tRNA ligase [Candidatus Parcubacteria bacterium]|nr:MAG: tryptophan--tRNA ligase [Candidatus Parcubacteria bacterium]
MKKEDKIKEAESKNIILTGMRPTGVLHLGHYFGVVPEILRMQKIADTLLVMIADVHALTTLEDSANLKKNSLILANTYLASGIDPEKSIIFTQSQVPEHAELSILLSMVSPVPMLELNPTYKEMREDHPKNNNLGLLAYPVMQAADILLYKATGVPIGKDQLPHLELAREIARRFNARVGKIFPVPKPLIQEETKKILSLQNPEKKMSKSHEEKSRISLLDSPDMIRSKFKVAVTDSETEIGFDEENKPAISNLLTIYSLFSGRSIAELEKEYEGKNYAVFKKDLAEVAVESLSPFHEKYKELEADPERVKSILRNGAQKAREIAAKTMAEVQEKVGFLDC